MSDTDLISVLISTRLTAEEIRNVFGVNPCTLRQWVRRGHIPRPSTRSGLGFYSPWPVIARLLRKSIQ